LKKLLKEIAFVRSGVFLKSHEPAVVNYLQTKDFDIDGKLKNKLYPSVSKSQVSENHFLKSGEILFAAKGWKNFAAICDNNMLPAVASTSFLVISLSVDYISPRFLVWWLNSERIQEFLKSVAKGTAIPSITKSQLENVEVIAFPMDIQEKLIRLSELRIRKKNLILDIEKLNEFKLELNLNKIIQNYE
jgi:restriction endonuclease S subunit